MTEIPSKYVPNKRQWEDKEWLYEQYWGQMKSLRSLSEAVDVGTRAIKEQMDKYGIPTRGKEFKPENTTSPFTGFYRDTPAQTTEKDYTTEDQPEKMTDDENLTWQKVAQKEEYISDKAIIQ